MGSGELLLFTARFWGDGIKVDNVGKTFSKHGRGETVVHRFKLIQCIDKKCA